MSSFTCRISAESAVFPGQHQTRSGIPSRVTAMPMTTWGRSSRWSLDLRQVRNPASSVTKYVLAVSRGKQVDLEPEQARGPVEDLPLQGLADLQQPVHCPVAGVVGRRVHARDQQSLLAQ
jgi:hypothetical protein